MDERRLRRACFQLTASPGALDRAETEVRGLHALRPALPICVSVAARDLEEIEGILSWGAERVTIALDVATPELHREIKGGPLEPRLALLRQAARRYPGRVGTHLIAGLGETERDLVTLMGEFGDLGVAAALFAFTPIPGTRLEGRPPPDLAAYRRAQAARYLMASGYARAEAMTFDGEGRLVSSGIPWEKARALLASGEAFRTSGCPDCNRPFYNERPSGPLYNYPRPLTATEAEAAVDEARPFGVAPASEFAVGESTFGKPRKAWRLIIEESPRPGAENMAVDEAILLAHAAGRVPPTLRFYRWTPPAVSLGYFQDYATDVDPEACRQAGIDIVRRTTGGRAVLHDQEVTYSIVVDMATLPGSVVETYRRIAGGLVFGLRALGLDAVLAPEKTAGDGPGEEAGGRTEGGSGAPTGAPAVAAIVAAIVAAGACFEVPSSYEILVSGKKIVGSAQVRRGGVILQHGSIPLRLDPPLLARVLGFPPEAAARIATKAAGLEETLDGAGRPNEVAACDGGQPGRVPPGYSDVCRAVSDGLAGALEVTFEPGDLTPEEAATAEGLVREKYSRETWNKKRPEKRPETEREES